MPAGRRSNAARNAARNAAYTQLTRSSPRSLHAGCTNPPLVAVLVDDVELEPIQNHSFSMTSIGSGSR